MRESRLCAWNRRPGIRVRRPLPTGRPALSFVRAITTVGVLVVGSTFLIGAAEAHRTWSGSTTVHASGGFSSSGSNNGSMTGVMHRTNPGLGLIVAGELDSLVGKKRVAGSGLTLDRRQVGDMLTDAPDGSAARTARETPPTSHPS